MPPLGVSQVNSIPTYPTDEKGNPLARVLGPNGAYGAPVAVVGFDDLVLDPLTQPVARIAASLGAPLTTGGVTASVTALFPVTGSGAYSSGDFVGTYTVPVSLPGLGRTAGGTGMILTALVLDKAVQSASLELWLFTTPAVVLPADNAAWSITDAELQSVVGVVPVGTYSASALNSVGVATNIGLAYKCAAGNTQLYGALVTRGTPTYTSTSDLTLILVAGLD